MISDGAARPSQRRGCGSPGNRLSGHRATGAEKTPMIPLNGVRRPIAPACNKRGLGHSIQNHLRQLGALSGCAAKGGWALLPDTKHSVGFEFARSVTGNATIAFDRESRNCLNTTPAAECAESKMWGRCSMEVGHSCPTQSPREIKGSWALLPDTRHPHVPQNTQPNAGGAFESSQKGYGPVTPIRRRWLPVPWFPVPELSLRLCAFACTQKNNVTQRRRGAKSRIT